MPWTWPISSISGRGVTVAVGLAAAFVCGVAAGQARGQAKSRTAPRMWADTVVDVTTGDLPRKARVRANIDHWDPGAGTGRHAHPGPTVFVLLEGELQETLPGGRTRTLTAGQGVWNPPGHEHEVRNVSGQPARGLALHLDPIR